MAAAVLEHRYRERRCSHRFDGEKIFALLLVAHPWVRFSARLGGSGDRSTHQALEDLSSISEFNGGHGPVFPALIGALTVVFGRDTAELVWTVRWMALLNPLLVYLLAKQLSSPAGGLVAAALVTLLGYSAMSKLALNIDAPLLMIYLLALLTLLAAIRRNSSLLALLSGVLLGTSILTKETAVVNVPLALLAVLLLDWELRQSLWHYLGAVLVCLPWWVWAYSATREVYLVGRLATEVQVTILIATALFLVLAAVAYASEMVARCLADVRRRRWIGWFSVLAWTVALSGLLLATTGHSLGKLSFEALRVYLGNLLDPSIVIVPTLLMIVGYVTWRVRRQNGAWRLLALALLLQAPVCLLVVVELWQSRQSCPQKNSPLRDALTRTMAGMRVVSITR